MKDIRKTMEQILKDEFRGLILRLHEKEDFTQERMANALLMDRRSLADLETGAHMCGTLTAVFMLICLEDGGAFLLGLRQRLEEAYEHAEVYV